MNCCEMIRRVVEGTLTIRLWVAGQCDEGMEECEERADELALCASTLADADDHPAALACKLILRLRGVTAVEVIDEHGDGCFVRRSDNDD